MIAISSDELKIRLARILTKYNFSKTDADLCAFIFTENTLAGVASHGVNRFPEFIDLVNRGFIKPASKPTLLNSFNGLEQWDGNYGPGPKNAWLITDKVLNLAEKFGIGCITLKNTNHWMRAATYGWKAAEKGFVFICWTNTIPNLPPWGAKESTTGNNPIVFAFPRKDGPVVLDMALSQFSYGKLSDYKTDGKLLPLDGGYDTKGELTKVPDEIIKSQRPLPVGF
jgi:3-dehydro-L-gulonate 2-dehydrogenase